MNTIFTYHNLYLAYLECRQNKRNTKNALAFEIGLETKLAKLLHELRGGTYRPGRSLCFIVTLPKPREIFAADFRDRIVHHLFVRELLPFAERRFTRDSFACRTGRGTHKAVAQLRHFIDQQREEKKLFFLQVDIQTFFPSIDKGILFSLTERLIRKSGKGDWWICEMLWLARVITFHDPTLSYRYRGDVRLQTLVPREKSLLFQPKGKGLPIGNHTSQFFANSYLNEVDHFVKRTLKCRQYVRYVDDMILLGTDVMALRQWRDEIDQFLRERLGVHLHPRKTVLQPVGKGIDFLGYFLKTDHALVRRRVVKRLKGKLRDFPPEPIGTEVHLIACLNSYCGHFRFARSFRLREHIYGYHLGTWQAKVEPVGTFASFRSVKNRGLSAFGVVEPLYEHERLSHFSGRTARRRNDSFR